MAMLREVLTGATPRVDLPHHGCPMTAPPVMPPSSSMFAMTPMIARMVFTGSTGPGMRHGVWQQKVFLEPKVEGLSPLSSICTLIEMRFLAFYSHWPFFSQSFFLAHNVRLDASTVRARTPNDAVRFSRVNTSPRLTDLGSIAVLPGEKA